MLSSTIDKDALRGRYQSARPFPSICIDDLLDREFIQEVAHSYPRYEEALAMGKSFDAVNEKLKVQVTDFSQFPDPVKRLSQILTGSPFLETLEYITGIRNLVIDPSYIGGGMHITAGTGRLDVHVDFNRVNNLYRRLNLLLYLNEEWKENWGGKIELWNQDVSHCEQSYIPLLGRCVLFTTSELSYHGVTPVHCPPGITRKSFALYYYTLEAPENIAKEHSTIFKARPNEPMRRYVLMPAERLKRQLHVGLRRTKQFAKKALGRL